MPVVPLLGSYKDACKCECCIGQGCSQRPALFTVAWVAYGFGMLWVLPSALEDSGEVGGKVLFGILQCVAMACMLFSRKAWEKNQAREMAATGRPDSNGYPMGVLVGAPAHGPSTLELQQQIRELQAQVQTLVRMQQIPTKPDGSAAIE
eukprot:gnl/TRDRNA2_/TRDRNA2_134141_c0_seq1.p1 gnl/TRDRNA2_/TRDRNA2_134141_c0~~gnl/TRDRNA2_/TRDRNA2_134141_c0_seq1.p1  ORF type:complete len:149 (-),score=35.01 gnl/TRDRNA2_/TRDRNA2_134141_c0_seq1:84-530(-)